MVLAPCCGGALAPAAGGDPTVTATPPDEEIPRTPPSIADAGTAGRDPGPPEELDRFSPTCLALSANHPAADESELLYRPPQHHLPSLSNIREIDLLPRQRESMAGLLAWAFTSAKVFSLASIVV